MVTAHRLRSSADIRRTVAARRAAGGAHVVVHARMRDHPDGPPRVAVVAGRRVGNAVARNRAKRRVRPLLMGMDLPDGVDLVVTAKAGADTSPTGELSDDLTKSLTRALRRAATAATS